MTNHDSHFGRAPIGLESSRTVAASHRRSPVKLLIAVWGQVYIERLEEFGFSSFLAPSNLPALAERCDVEIVILTKRSEAAHFEKLKSMARINALADVTYVAIDDLIGNGPYSVTLTLAFMRGLARFGADMTTMHFIFWNADFVLSDGAFACLARHIASDRKIVLTGSLRAAAEDVEPILASHRERRQGVLAMPSRSLVGLTLRYPHPTMQAKTVNQELVHTREPNQLFWRVDDETLIGRFFQSFMLCIKPTRALTRINGYCDYAFIPELCPGEPVEIISDSDELVLLELQNRDQEAELLVRGKHDPTLWLESIRRWCTPEHFATAAQAVIFHSGPIPDRAAAVVRQSALWLEELKARLGAHVSHARHYYWASGVAVWLAQRSGRDRAKGIPPEIDLALSLEDLKHASYQSLWQARRPRSRAPASKARVTARGVLERLLGTLPEIGRLNPDARSLRPLVARVQQVQQRVAVGDASVLVVADPDPWLDHVFPFDRRGIYRALPHILAGWLLSPDASVAEALVVLSAGAPADIDRLLRQVSRAVVPGGRITIALRSPIAAADGAWLGLARDAIRFRARNLLADIESSEHKATTADVLYARRFAHWLGRAAGNAGMAHYALCGLGLGRAVLAHQLVSDRGALAYLAYFEIIATNRAQSSDAPGAIAIETYRNP